MPSQIQGETLACLSQTGKGFLLEFDGEMELRLEAAMALVFGEQLSLLANALGVFCFQNQTWMSKVTSQGEHSLLNSCVLAWMYLT